MEMMTSSWTDDRMNDLKRQVDELGRRTDEGFREQRREMDSRFERVEGRLDGMQQSIVDLHGTMARFAMMLVVALIGLTATQLGLILTQL
jgi:hypothetical protein